MSIAQRTYLRNSPVFELYYWYLEWLLQCFAAAAVGSCCYSDSAAEYSDSTGFVTAAGCCSTTAILATYSAGFDCSSGPVQSAGFAERAALVRAEFVCWFQVSLM